MHGECRWGITLNQSTFHGCTQDLDSNCFLICRVDFDINMRVVAMFYQLKFQIRDEDSTHCVDPYVLHDALMHL